eukprot:762471-Pelagomonas_calceolata.AAC.1
MVLYSNALNSQLICPHRQAALEDRYSYESHFLSSAHLCLGIEKSRRIHARSYPALEPHM